MQRRIEIGADEIEHDCAELHIGGVLRGDSNLDPVIALSLEGSVSAPQSSNKIERGRLQADMGQQFSAFWEEGRLGLDLHAVGVANQDGGPHGKAAAHGRHPQSFAPVSLWARIWRAVPSVS